MSGSATKAESKSGEVTFLLQEGWPSSRFVFTRHWRLPQTGAAPSRVSWFSFTLGTLIFNSTHMFATAGSSRVSFLSSFGRYMLHWFMRYVSLLFPAPAPSHPIPAPSHPLFIICLAGYFVSLHWPHLRLILYMLGMSDNDHRISLSIRNSYCN